MYPDGLTSLSYEKPVLYLISVLLDSGFQLGAKLTIQSEMGDLVFESLDLIQERGKIPLIKLDFDGVKDNFLFEFQYFGHVAPHKFHSVKFEKSENELIEYTFADVNKDYGKLEADYDQKISLDSIDIKLLCGSLYLWRSCVALPKICEESLSKYLKKMKSVSRYEWKLESYSRDLNKIVEKWSCVALTDSYGDKCVSVTLCDGIVENVEMV